MDKHTIIGLLIIFGLFLGYSFYTSNSAKKEREKQMVEQQKQKKKGDKEKTKQLSDTTLSDSLDIASLQDSVPAAATTAAKTARNTILGYEDTTKTNDFVVRTNMAEYHFARYGGYVKYVKLNNIYKYAPKGEKKQELVLFDEGATMMSIPLQVRDSVQSFVNTSECYFSATKDTIDVKSGKGHLRLYLHPYKQGDSTVTEPTVDQDAYILYDYTFSDNDYMFDYTVKFHNMSKYIFKHGLNLEWNSTLYTAEKNVKAERDLTTLYYMDNRDEVSNLNERESDTEDVPTEMKWVSFKQQFFTSILIAKEGEFKKGKFDVTVDKGNDNNPLLKKMKSRTSFDISNFDEGQFAMEMYFGPNKFKDLKKYEMNLEKQVPLGWGFFLLHWINRFVVIPIFNWLEAYGINYGIIILILSIFIKIVILPLAYKTYLSSAKMRVLKPEIDELNAKYPKQEDAMKKQQATMTLYKKAGISPMGGCLPMLIQMPILIAMYRFFPAAYELRQQSFLWAEDLSAYDSILDLSFNVPFYGDHVSLFTLLMTAATLVYTWLNNKMMAAGNNDQMKVMKWMMYLMPILFLGMFNSFASALTYYYLLINLITFLQMWIFRVAINEKKLREKMQNNMVKPVKKTKWQARMEEMIKQQQQMQQQQTKAKRK